MSTERLRLAGIDAPELHARCAEEYRQAVEARDFAQRALDTAAVVRFRLERREKWGRSLGRVYVDGADLSELLLQAGLVRPYSGERRKPWCD